MRHRVLRTVLGVLCLVPVSCGGRTPTDPTPPETVDYRAELRSALQALSDQAPDPLLRLHFNSIQQVTAAGDHGWSADDQAIKDFWQAVIYYREGRAEDALLIFSQLRSTRPNDRPLQYFIERAQA